MKSIKSISLIFLIALFTLVVGCQQQPDIAKIKIQVNEMNDMTTKAILENDQDAVLKFYTNDAISLPSYQPIIRGLEEIKKVNDKQKEMPMNMKTFSLTSTDVWASGKFVVDIGTYDLTMEMAEMPDGVMKDHGKYLTLYEIQDNGSLLMKADTWNTDMNPWEEMMKSQHSTEGMEMDQNKKM